MKHLIYCAILVLCTSCAFSDRAVEVKNNEATAFKQARRVEFTDSCIIIHTEAEIEMKESYKNFELTFDCKTAK